MTENPVQYCFIRHLSSQTTFKPIEMSIDQQPASGFLSTLALETRQQIYDIYMLQYLRDAPQFVAGFGSWGESCERGSKGERLISFERPSGQGGDYPPLMRTCRQVGEEMRIIASQYIRFAIGSSSTLLHDEERERDLVLGLPKRCELPQLPGVPHATTMIKHLEIEWRLNPNSVLPESSLPVKQVNMLDCLHKIRELFQDESTSNANIDKDTRPSLAKLTSVRFDFVVPYEFGQRLAPQESFTFSSYRFLGWGIEPVLNVVMAELPKFSPSLQTFEFTGIVGNKWLPMQEAKLTEKGIKMFRTLLNPNKRPRKRMQLHFVCGEQDHVYKD